MKPWWWPTWWDYDKWYSDMYPANYTARTFFGEGNYTDLSIYMQDWTNSSDVLRVDRLSEMTILRKQAILERLQNDLVATQTLFDKTTGERNAAAVCLPDLLGCCCPPCLLVR